MNWVETIGSLAVLTACLALNWRAYRTDSADLPFETKAIMAVSWVVIIAVMAFVMGRLS